MLKTANNSSKLSNSISADGLTPCDTTKTWQHGYSFNIIVLFSIIGLILASCRWIPLAKGLQYGALIFFSLQLIASDLRCQTGRVCLTSLLCFYAHCCLYRWGRYSLCHEICLVVGILSVHCWFIGCIYPCPLGLPHWYQVNCMIGLVPGK